ncbi:unnamed protein product [Diplocarpon coronariae]
MSHTNVEYSPRMPGVSQRARSRSDAWALRMPGVPVLTGEADSLPLSPSQIWTAGFLSAGLPPSAILASPYSSLPAARPGISPPHGAGPIAVDSSRATRSPTLPKAAVRGTRFPAHLARVGARGRAGERKQRLGARHGEALEEPRRPRYLSPETGHVGSRSQMAHGQVARVYEGDDGWCGSSI